MATELRCFPRHFCRIFVCVLSTVVLSPGSHSVLPSRAVFLLPHAPRAFIVVQRRSGHALDLCACRQGSGELLCVFCFVRMHLFPCKGRDLRLCTCMCLWHQLERAAENDLGTPERGLVLRNRHPPPTSRYHATGYTEEAKSIKIGVRDCMKSRRPGMLNSDAKMMSSALLHHYQSHVC